jgi:hypothetical protein
MKAILTAVLIITASGASAQSGRFVTTALPNGDIVITDSAGARIRKCKWDGLSGSIQTGDLIMGYACSDWQSIKYSDD